MKVVNYVQIDFSRNKDITVPSIQYDSGTRWVMVKLYNNGVPIDLHDLKVFIMAVKPDGKEVFNNCNVIDPDDGLIKFEITEQMGFVKGEVECQIKLMDQDRLLSSDIFKLNVNKSLSFENSESTNQLTTLVDALYRVEHLDAELSGEFRDTFNTSQLEREESFNDSQMDREEVFNSSQLNREETFNVSETERENIFDNSQVNREERFNASQAEREDKFNDKLDQFEERFLEIKGEKGDKGDKGDRGLDGRGVELGVYGGQVKWRYAGQAENVGWTSLISLDSLKGAQGPIGLTGPQGPKGDKGDQGEVGAIGPIGLQGPIGLTGPQGETGPQGPKGEKGLDGRSVELGVYGGQVKWRYAGQEENVGWTPLISLDSLRGSQGPQGEKGETGPQGPKGEKGDSGGVMPADMVDYMGNQHETLKAKNDADVDWLLGEINTAHYEGQQITATDSIEGRAKSAILNGQTLVNVKPKTNLSKWGMSSYDLGGGVCSLNGANSGISFEIDLLKPSTRYLVNVEILELPTYEVEHDYPLKITIGNSSKNYVDIKKEEMKLGFIKKVITTTDTFTDKMSIGNRGTFTTPIKVRFMLIEYIENMENWDIPYFEGMQSVNMPVLKSIGKNLFDKTKITKDMKLLSTGVTSSETGTSISDFIQVLSNENYYLDYGNTYTSRALCFYDENKSFISGLSSQYIINFTTPTNCKYVRFNIASIESDNVQLELGSTKTAYEPYKSNILTVNEEVELRGIGDVKDELNLLTGEVVERVSEIVLDGSEEWNVSGHSNWTSCYTRKYILPHLINKGTSLVSDKMMSYIYYDYLGNNDVIGISVTNEGYICFKYLPNGSKPQPSEVSDYLKSNPITIQYPLETDSIKTVDLSGQKVYSYDGTTHYICGSEDGSLIPSLSIDVPTNLPALVSRQRATIESQKEQIQTLEVENEILTNEIQRVDEKGEQADLEQLSMTWEIDYRVSELEWFVEDNISSTMTVAETMNLKSGGNTMALSRFEQAKILILAGAYNRETLEKQLTNYLKRGYLTTEEYDELIALMDAKELVSEN